jgi:hypothetical protein
MKTLAGHLANPPLSWKFLITIGQIENGVHSGLPFEPSLIRVIRSCVSVFSRSFICLLLYSTPLAHLAQSSILKIPL